MSSKKITKKAVATVLSAVALGAAGLVMAGCNKKGGSTTVGYIDAPEAIQAELGTYVVPEYDVVDKNGMVLYGYNVKLKSVTDASGEELEINYRAVTVETAGVYDFVYTANSDGVSDVTVKIDFADRTAPAINYDESNLPDFYITGNSYKMPAYTISGEFDREKSYAKVYHVAADKTETEVAISSNRFKVEETSGSYAIRIHVEDAAGNSRDYEYIRAVDGPEHFVENKVLYFDEAFGARQVSLYQPDKYSGGFVSEDTAGAHVYDGESGAYKISFDGVTETQNNEGLISMNVPAVVDITDYIELEMYVYNDSDVDIIMGSQWWNDTSVKKGEWTKLTWAVDSDGWSSNKSADNTKVIGPVDITGMTIRFVFDYDKEVIPTGDFYLSSMRAVPKVKSAITAGDNVSLERPDGAYFAGETVKLSAANVSGKTFDCFLVDGKPIIGDNFVARNATHAVTAKYIDGALTKDNMTWGVVEEYETVGADAKAYKLGESDAWALTYDLYGMGGDGWNYFGAYIGGTDQLIGIELSGPMGGPKSVFKAAGYGGVWKGMTDINLSDEVTALIRGATEANPVTAIFMREGDDVKLLLKSGQKTYFIAAWDFKIFEVSGNGFGIGERSGPTNATLKNIKGVSGATRVNLFKQALKVNIAKTSVTTDKADYYLGDKVTLTATAAPSGKAFDHFEVDGVRITGNSFVVTELKNYEVEAVFLDTELTYKVTVEDHADYVKLTNGKYTLPTADVRDNELNVKDYAVNVTVVDMAGNSYTVTDGKIDISYAGSVRLAITYTAPTLHNDYDTVTVYVTLQSGEVLFAPTAKSLGYVKNVETDEAKVNAFEFVTDKKHGTDAGSVKVTPQEDDTGFTIEDFDFTGYDFVEFYAYTEGTGVQAGAYWLGDTALTRNAWTKVVIVLKGDGNNHFVHLKDNDGNSFIPTDAEHRGKPYRGKLVLRVMSNGAKAPVWISSVTAGVWPAATITPDDDNVILDKDSYKVNDIVTLSHKPAPTGKTFSHYEVDDVEITGNTFKVTKTSHTVKVVYSNSSKIKIAAGSGISTDDGKTQYAVGTAVTLLFDESKTPSGQVFDCFKVDGVKVNGNTFTTTASEHEVTAAFVTSASEMTWATTQYVAPTDTVADGKYRKLGSADNWVLSYDVTATNADTVNPNNDIPGQWYAGVLFRNKQLVGFHLGGNAQHAQYFGSGGDDAGSTWDRFTTLDEDVMDAMNAASAQNPVTLTFIRQGNKLSVYVKSGDVIYKVLKDFTHTAFDTQYGLDFGYGWREQGGNPTINNIKWITGAGKVGLYNSQTLKTTINKTKVTTDKPEYYIGDTVTLTAADAASGEIFSHFTVDGTRISGNTFTVTKKTHTVAAVYTTVSNVNFAANSGISTSDGKTQYARNATVTLLFDESKTPSGQAFDCFKVDGEKINGNTFTTSAASHEVTAVFITSASEMTWGTVSEYQTTGDNVKTHKLGESDNWVLSYDFYGVGGTDWNYLGAYIGGSNQLLGIELAGTTVQKAAGYNGYSTQEVSLSNELTALIRGATETNPVTAIYVRNNDTIKLMIKSSEEMFVISTWNCSSFDMTGNSFGIGERSGPTNATLSNIRFISGAGKVGLYNGTLKTTITKTNVTTDKTEYYIGDTVALTAATAPSGQAFSHFTVDGVRISGNTFKVTKLTHTVTAQYSEVSVLTIGEGVTASDASGLAHSGTFTAARNVVITLEYDAVPAGRALDCFKVDGVKIVGNTFTTSAAAHTIEAVLIDNIDQMTWQSKADDNAVCVNSGEGIYAVKLGNAEEWAVRYTVTNLPEGKWGQLAGVYIGATSQIASLQFSGTTYTFNLYGGPIWSGSVAIPANVAEIIKRATANLPVELAFVKSGNYLTAYAISDGKTYVCGKLDISDYLSNGQATNDFGFAYRDAPYEDGRTFGIPTLSGDLESIIGESKVGFYNAAIAAQTGRMSENQINSVKAVTKASNSGTFTSGYITTGIPEGLNDSNVKENGVLKVNAQGNEASFTANLTFDSDPTKYSEIYFYVYIENADKSAEEMSYVAGGSYWKDGNSYAIDATNKWVKITFDSARIAELAEGAATDLSKFVFRIYSQTWNNGYTDITGKTLYVTSLYGVPKGVEPIVQNGATSYSLVCDDSELKEVVNESFFPDAE